MKLLEILTKEWTRWPSGVSYVVQSGSGLLSTSKCKMPKINCTKLWWLPSTCEVLMTEDGCAVVPLASDFDTAVVTKTAWEEAVKLLAEKTEWKGRDSGPPPAGTWCMYQPELDGDWYKAHIIGLDSDGWIVFEWQASEHTHMELDNTQYMHQFKPLPTKAGVVSQIAKFLFDSGSADIVTATTCAMRLYDSGFVVKAQ